MSSHIQYSDKYADDVYEYRHVILPDKVAKNVRLFFNSKNLLTEADCRQIGVKQSPGWQHYAWHDPEPHILLFRRPVVVAATPSPSTCHENP